MTERPARETARRSSRSGAGLARSRQHAVELIAEGRVRIAGMPAHKAATGVDPDTPLQVIASQGRAGGLPGCAQAGRRARPLAPAAGRGPALPGCRRIDRRLHPGPARARSRPGRRGRRRVRPAGLVAADRRSGRRPRPHQRPRPHADRDRGFGRAHRRRPVVHLAHRRPARRCPAASPRAETAW